MRVEGFWDLGREPKPKKGKEYHWASKITMTRPQVASRDPMQSLDRSDKFVSGEVPDPWRNHSCRGFRALGGFRATARVYHCKSQER